MDDFFLKDWSISSVRLLLRHHEQRFELGYTWTFLSFPASWITCLGNCGEYELQSSTFAYCYLYAASSLQRCSSQQEIDTPRPSSPSFPPLNKVQPFVSVRHSTESQEELRRVPAVVAAAAAALLIFQSSSLPRPPANCLLLPVITSLVHCRKQLY